MRETDIETDINITLLSPMKMATLRTTTAGGTYQLKDLIENTILLSLIDDGFTVGDFEIKDKQITVNYLVETIEYCLNNLSNKFNFWWFIDKYKVIHIKDISNMFKNNSDYIYDDTHRIGGLQYIKPTIHSDDYANVVNFKNVRIYEYSRVNFSNSAMNHNPLIDKQIAVLKKDGQVDFNYPVDINEKNIIKSGKSNLGEAQWDEVEGGDRYYYGIKVQGSYSDNSTFKFYIRYNATKKIFETSTNLGFENDGKEFTLIKDSFFSNLVTGFKYNGESKSIKSIELMNSDSVLIWNVNKLYNDKAITEKKGKISSTGIVETTLDMNESWKTIQELRDIGISYMDKNSLKLNGTIELCTDKEIFEIGKIIDIDKFLITGKYIITEIREVYSNNDMNYYIIAKNSNMLNNFIDIFRGEATQESENKTYKMYVTHYEEENIYERHEVVQ